MQRLVTSDEARAIQDWFDRNHLEIPHLARSYVRRLILDREERITLLREQDQEAFEFLTVDGAVIDD